jgi:Arc/MetJ-type ribon-helix-helix transcriptional regulator
MTKAFEAAIAEVEGLSEADQEQIGRQLLSHVEKLRRLRAELDKGIQSLDAGKGEPLDIEKFIEGMNTRHAGS